MDHPRDYKKHHRATPYLGGLAVMAGFLAGAIAFGSGISRFEVLLLAAVGLCIIGTVDDRRNVAVLPRLAAAIIAAVALYEAGLGWSLVGDGAINLALTIFWVVGLVNAFNLMDNLDGATGTAAGVSAAGAGFIALGYGDSALGARRSAPWPWPWPAPASASCATTSPSPRGSSSATAARCPLA
jgi:UDP-GlcNAc:undecaprenyl-phosphate GlcNAc-1-phosphate transferase